LNSRAGLELRALAENLLVRLEAHPRAAPVVDLAFVGQLRLRRAARVFLPVKRLVAGDLHLQVLGQRVDHRHAHAMQAAGRFVDLVCQTCRPRAAWSG
jgi:hypothetical protein